MRSENTMHIAAVDIEEALLEMNKAKAIARLLSCVGDESELSSGTLRSIGFALFQIMDCVGGILCPKKGGRYEQA